jgi:hypothetical protein
VDDWLSFLERDMIIKGCIWFKVTALRNSRQKSRQAMKEKGVELYFFSILVERNVA